MKFSFKFINPKSRIPRVYPWMNVNSPEERRAQLEMWKGATGLPVGFPHFFTEVYNDVYIRE